MNHGKKVALSGVHVRTMMEFKNTSVSAVHLSLSCTFLTVAALTDVLKKIYKTSCAHELNTGSEGETLEGMLECLKGI